MDAGRTPRCLTIATSDSGGGAGVQADIKAFAAAGCHGSSVIVAVTAQNTIGVQHVHELPVPVIEAQFASVMDDIGADAIKTGALVSRTIVETVAARLGVLRDAGALPPLVVDPVLHATAGGTLLDGAALDVMVHALLPLATVVTPNDAEARALAGGDGDRATLAERIVARGAAAVVITAGAGEPCDHLFDGQRHIDIPVDRVPSRATHGGGCTHSATMCAEMAKGSNLETAARRAASAARAAIVNGVTDIGAGEGPVDVLGIEGRR